MRSAPPAHARTRKVRKRGRHRVPRTGARRAVQAAGVAVPALAIAGAIAGAQLHPFNAAAVGSVTSYRFASPAAAPSVRPAAATADSVVATSVTGPAEAVEVKQRGLRSASGRTAEAAGSRGRNSAGNSASAAKPQPSAPPTEAACTGTGPGSAFLPENYVAIVNFLVANGYTDMAASGIAGNIYQESGGNPESIGSGGGGLIGWTPLPANYVTGDPTADLATQLSALLVYNEQWASYIPALNAATNPTDAADIYMNDFERPGIPAAYNRESAAVAVAAACGFGSLALGQRRRVLRDRPGR